MCLDKCAGICRSKKKRVLGLSSRLKGAAEISAAIY